MRPDARMRGRMKAGNVHGVECPSLPRIGSKGFVMQIVENLSIPNEYLTNTYSTNIGAFPWQKNAPIKNKIFRSEHLLSQNEIRTFRSEHRLCRRLILRQKKIQKRFAISFDYDILE